MPLPNGTVGMFLLMLTSKIAQWDAKYGKNPYGLALMLEAADRLRVGLDEAGVNLDSAAHADLETLKNGIRAEFTKMRWRDSVIKQIDDFIVKGKRPTITGAVAGRGQAGY